MPKKASFTAFSSHGILPHPLFARVEGCTLTTKDKVRQCIYPAIAARYGKPVTDKTKLGNGGLGLDDITIRTDLYATTVIAVHNAGCKLRSFSPDDIAQCKTAGDITDGIWADLSAA